MPSTTITAMDSSFPGSPYVSVRKLGEGSFGQVSWRPEMPIKYFFSYVFANDPSKIFDYFSLSLKLF
jgi:hypothetical protein